jgi:spore maturation protein CgeB
MRIFYAADSTPNGKIKSNVWDINLRQTLVELGHNVIQFKYDLTKTFQNLNKNDPIQKQFIKKNRSEISNALLQQIKSANKEKQIDLFFSYFYDACITPSTINEIKSLGIKTVNWYCNASYQLHLVSEISPHYDYCLVPEKFRLNDYRKLGAHPLYCQEGANPNIYKPYNVPKEFDVTFVGQAYGERPDYIKHLVDNKINIQVWGPEWHNFSEKFKQIQNSFLLNSIKKAKKIFTANGLKIIQEKIKNVFVQQNKENNVKMSSAIIPNNIIGPVLSDEEMIKMYSRSKINLGFSTCENTHKTENRIVQINLRDFEVPMSGGFYMVEHMEELEEFFEIGKEIVCYKDKDDLVDKINYYLKHDAEREKIRLAGHKRCLKDHTRHQRFTSAFKQMNL